ncbi:MAG: signal recognition particle-docking protein FtsY [Alphaproteobacteria bacterium]|nr:signal recognition particle-docking protein FtsY [Alphaproteobacteria bacterium]
MSDEKIGWFKKIGQGLKKSSDRLTTGMVDIFTKKKPDAQTLDDLEELLLMADFGPKIAGHCIDQIRKKRIDKNFDAHMVKEILADEIKRILMPVEQPLPLSSSSLSNITLPQLIMIVGINGGGKTTTVGKLGSFYQQIGHKVMFAAGDTFRAAAVEQLQIWGKRINVPVIIGSEKNDPAALAFDAYQQAQKDNMDILLLDTAGRLHNKSHLMDELKKIERVVKKIDPTLPHYVILVLDATLGQNAIVQIETFKEIVPLSGLIITKLDGTAKGGIVVALAEKFQLPIYAIGVGEKFDDLRPFDADLFTHSLLDLDTKL